jgi:putative SOS response-associated peptidase YedK
MCGRYTLTQPQDIVDRFEIEAALRDLYDTPTYNAAPTQILPVVVASRDRNTLDLMKWGLIPSWAKDGVMKFSTINARAEGLEDKSTYRGPFRHKRCIVPADGFYEWKRQDSQKQPYYFTLEGNPLFGFAGLWDSWTDAAGSELHTFTIVTTSANEIMQPIHDRMPVILEPQYEAAWLDPSIDDVHLLHSFLRPYTASNMQCMAVSKAVNTVKNNQADLIGPIDSK